MTMSVSFQRMRAPAERAEAKRRSEDTGKFRSSRIARISPPTNPVAPTIPTA
jgi:hypothetical protein